MKFLKWLEFGFGATHLITSLENNVCQAPGNLNSFTFLL